MIVLLCGENEFAVSAAYQKKVSDFLVQHDAFGLERLDGETLEPTQLSGALLQLPFLASKKLVVVKSIFANKLSSEKLIEILPYVPDEVDVVLVDSKADKRTRLYKTMLKNGQVIEHKNLSGSGLEKWAVSYAAESGGSILPATAAYLVDRVGDSQILLAREIEKLAPLGDMSMAHIDELTEQTMQSTVFELLDKVFAGKQAGALDVYDRLVVVKTDPSEIIALVGWQLHVLALVKYAGPGAPSDVAKLTGLHPYVVGKALNVVRSLTSDQLKYAVSRTLEVDVQIKTGLVDAASAAKVLIAELSA